MLLHSQNVHTLLSIGKVPGTHFYSVTENDVSIKIYFATK